MLRTEGFLYTPLIGLAYEWRLYARRFSRGPLRAFGRLGSRTRGGLGVSPGAGASTGVGDAGTGAGASTGAGGASDGATGTGAVATGAGAPPPNSTSTML